MLLRMNELARVERIRRAAGAKNLVRGIGDDCAVYRPRRGEDLVFTIDLLIEDVHFARALFPPEAVGHKALAVSLSDIAAMGATPRFALLSLAVPRGVPDAWVDAFFRGFLRLAKRFDTTLAGGDLSRADKVIADVMVAGAVKHDQALTRDGARPGDVIYVSGRLGKPWQTHQRPQPRIALGKELAGRATACMDLSDGLSLDLHRLCLASGAAAALDRVPRARGASLQQALHGGEDYELLFTLPPRRRAPRGVTRIGVITRGPAGEVRLRGELVPPMGYDHFRD